MTYFIQCITLDFAAFIFWSRKWRYFQKHSVTYTFPSISPDCSITNAILFLVTPIYGCLMQSKSLEQCWSDKNLSVNISSASLLSYLINYGKYFPNIPHLYLIFLFNTISIDTILYFVTLDKNKILNQGFLLNGKLCFLCVK